MHIKKPNGILYIDSKRMEKGSYDFLFRFFKKGGKEHNEKFQFPMLPFSDEFIS